MRREKLPVYLLCGALLAGVSGTGAIFAQASFEQSVEAGYNTAVQGQDALDGLDVTVSEKTVSSATNLSAQKTVSLKVSGIRGNSLKADIEVDTDEGTTESYYQNGYYYTTTSDGNQKREMDRTAIWDMINSEIYMNMTSNYLKMLYAETENDGTVTYHFAATAETLGDYSKTLLEGSSDDQGIVIDGLQGTMQTNAQGSILNRSIRMIYTVTQGENEETFMVQTDAEFNQNGEAVSVTLPDLSDYEEPDAEQPAETITPLQRTVYTTSDVNVRAAGNLTAVILGCLSSGSGVTETGYTSDGWIQIQYNGSTGYIWGDYISTKEPVLTRTTSGTMYATTAVNVRSEYSSDSTILGSLSKGQGIEITGTTDNNWIRVKYNGSIGYVYADYLSWSEPISDTYVQSGCITGIVTNASYGSLTIERDDGQGSAYFNTTYAVMSLKDSIYMGDRVEVYYTGSGTPYTATQVNDYIRHDDTDETRSVSVEGVVVSCSPTTLELSGSDGIYRTFNITDADIEMTGPLSEGQVVTVSWMSSANGAETKNIAALRVRA
jgi:uncharacterized protein YgiM (DUF1202 family)